MDTDLQTLGRHVDELARRADAATKAYDRFSWIGYTLVFVPVPFAVLVFRHQMQAWHYYVAGAVFLIVAVALYAVELVSSRRRDNAIHALRQAQIEYEAASRLRST